MDKNIFNILTYLEPHGIGVEHDFANALRDIFIVNVNAGDLGHEVRHQASLLTKYLNYLIAYDLISMTERPDKSFGERIDTAFSFRWIDGTTPISAAITLNGYKLLQAEREKIAGTDIDSSVKNTNKATIDNLPKQNRLAIVSVIVAFAAVIVAFLSYYSSKPTDEIKERLRQLELKQTEIQEQSKKKGASLTIDTIHSLIVIDTVK